MEVDAGPGLSPVTTPTSEGSCDWVDVSMWDVVIEQLRDLMVLQRLVQTKLNKVRRIPTFKLKFICTRVCLHLYTILVMRHDVGS